MKNNGVALLINSGPSRPVLAKALETGEEAFFMVGQNPLRLFIEGLRVAGEYDFVRNNYWRTKWILWGTCKGWAQFDGPCSHHYGEPLEICRCGFIAFLNTETGKGWFKPSEYNDKKPFRFDSVPYKVPREWADHEYRGYKCSDN